MKILFVVERPTQFEAPFFRHAAADPEHRLEVLFTRPDPGGAVHDPELGRSVSWGIDLTSGYPWAAPEAGEHPALWTAREVRRRRPNLVLVNGYTRREYLAAALAARAAGIPTALRTDSVLFPGEEEPGRAKRLLVSVLQAGLFHLFFTTGTLGGRYLESCGVPKQRIGLFPYAVDVDHFRAASALSREEWRQRRGALGIPLEDRVILSLAKFSDREAPWDLLRAFGKLAGNDATLVLAGDGPERETLEESAAEAGKGRVLFPGYVPYTELPALYGISDLFVHPAAEERWGVSVAEAMAAGLPVVASSRVGAAYDLVNPGENGGLYRAGDAADLAGALETALALDRKTVAEVDRSVLASQDYPSTWQSLLRTASRFSRSPSGAVIGDEAATTDRRPVPLRQRWVPKLVRALPRSIRRHKVIALLTRLMPWTRIATFRFNAGALVTADLSDPAPRQVLITGVFEPELFTLAGSFVAPHTAVLDVGANHGFCAFGLAASTPVSQDVAFHLFEANPHLCEHLRETALLYPGHTIRVTAGCVSEHEGRSQLRIVHGHSGTSHIVEDATGSSVENVVLDSYLESAGIGQVSLVKLDIEGWEPQALFGLSRALADGRIGALYLEVSGPNLARYGSEPCELIDLLRDRGCEVFWCREEDFAAELAPRPSSVIVRPGVSLDLAAVREFPRSHQTDLLAIPRNGMYGELLSQIE